MSGLSRAALTAMRGIRQEIDYLTISASSDLATAHMLIRAGGTLKTGRVVDYWVRVSNFCERSTGRWLITHEHVSLPVDMKTGKVVMDLVP